MAILDIFYFLFIDLCHFYNKLLSIKKLYKLSNIGKCIASQIHHPLDRVRGWESVKC